MFSGFWLRLRAANPVFHIRPASEQAAFIRNAIADSIRAGTFSPSEAPEPHPLAMDRASRAERPKDEDQPHDDLAGTTSHPVYEHWTCGTAHIRAQRVLRIIERCADYGLTITLIEQLENLVDDAGLADCRRALAPQPDEVPF